MPDEPRHESVSFLAHSANGHDGNGRVEPLHEHLTEVARLCGDFAAAFGAQDQAHAAGLLHDLGKYSQQFLRRLQDPRSERGRDHWFRPLLE